MKRFTMRDVLSVWKMPWTENPLAEQRHPDPSLICTLPVANRLDILSYLSGRLGLPSGASSLAEHTRFGNRWPCSEHLAALWLLTCDGNIQEQLPVLFCSLRCVKGELIRAASQKMVPACYSKSNAQSQVSNMGIQFRKRRYKHSSALYRRQSGVSRTFGRFGDASGAQFIFSH
jgi:hypothetical protein